MSSAWILVPTSLWHAAAAWHFLLYPERPIRRSTRERPVNPIAIELFRFLGSLNGALVVFALLLIRLPASSAWIAFTGFSLANLSQAVIDARVARLGLAHGPMFRTIFWGDALICALNAGAAVAWGIGAVG